MTFTRSFRILGMGFVVTVAMIFAGLFLLSQKAHATACQPQVVVRPGTLQTAGVTGDGCVGGGGSTVLISETFPWGESTYGLAHSNTGDLSASEAFTGVAHTILVDRNVYTSPQSETILLPHASISISTINMASGSVSSYEYNVHLYDAINGDQGNFTLSSSGTVLSGSVAAYDTLRNEIQGADPNTISAALEVVPNAFKIGQFAGISSCAGLAGVAGAIGLAAIFAPEMLTGIADWLNNGGGYALSAAAGACGSYLAQ